MHRIRLRSRALTFSAGVRGALLVALMVAPASARADALVPEPRAARSPRVELALVAAAAAPDAPGGDIARVQSDVHGQLARATGRVQQCLAGDDLREDPLRSRARRMEIHVRLTRSGRPERVWVHSDTGMPPAARRCLLEAVRAVSVRPAPRGDVVVRVVYQLR